jgi:Spy/CpxP family protein refolding chaperone
MKTGWKSLIVVGAVLALVSSQVLAQPGNAWGRGPRHAVAPGAGVVPHTPGPMGLGMGGPGGGCAFCCPLGPAPGGLLRLGWWLDLTDEQAKQIKTIYDKAQADANTAAEAVVSARDTLHKAVISGATDAQIQSAATALGTAIGNQAALAAKTLTSAKSVLTDEQRQELEKIQTKFTPLQHRRGPMAGDGRGNGWGRGANQRGGGPPWQHVPQQ